MEEQWIELTPENLAQQHVCCAIGDPKHKEGVAAKKKWLQARLAEGHVFRRLDERGKVFIEYAPLETAWVPVLGENYLYIYCLWVAGAFKGKGYGKALLEACILDAKAQGRSGVCVLSAGKKRPYLSDKKFLQHVGFTAVDTAGDGYELLALSFDGTRPRFTQAAKSQTIPQRELTIYYSPQCPYICNCVQQVRRYCAAQGMPLRLMAVDDLEKAKAVPCVFNNWAVFYQGKFQTLQLLNENALKKLLAAAGAGPAGIKREGVLENGV